ncbi:hypothetical protein [Saccharopolyspora griseoalba]|uniref:Uncharacterized protein n=1 Tax=Saccharopolyspora griseoalba TaxID=1431848 RepID=A0ABW2LQS2_9PSEU
MANNRQALSRHARTTARARIDGDYERVTKYTLLQEKKIAEYRRMTGGREPRIPEVIANRYAPPMVAHWTDDELEAQYAKLNPRDPQEGLAQYQIFAVMEQRQQERDAAANPTHQAQATRQITSWEASSDQHASPLTVPSQRGDRKLTAKQRLREEYDRYLDDKVRDADEACRGQFFNAETRQRLADPNPTATEGLPAELVRDGERYLLQGSIDRVHKYGSTELINYCERNGHVSFTDFQAHYGWQSARETVRTRKSSHTVVS